MFYKMLGEIPYPFPISYGEDVEIWKYTTNLIHTSSVKPAAELGSK